MRIRILSPLKKICEQVKGDKKPPHVKASRQTNKQLHNSLSYGNDTKVMIDMNCCSTHKSVTNYNSIAV